MKVHHDVTTDYTELRDKQQKVWSSGDYNKIAALTVPVSRAPRRPRRGHLPASTSSTSPPAPATSALAAARRGAGHRHRLRAGAHRHRPRPRRRRAPRRSTSSRPTPSTCPSRTASFDVVSRPSASCSPPTTPSAARELVRVTARRPLRPGELDARGLRRRDARRRGPARHAPPPARSRRPAGASRRSWPSCSATRSPTSRRRTATAPRVHRRRGVRRLVPRPTTARRSPPPAGWTSGSRPAARRPGRRSAARSSAAPRTASVLDWEYRIVTGTRR